MLEHQKQISFTLGREQKLARRQHDVNWDPAQLTEKKVFFQEARCFETLSIIRFQEEAQLDND